MRCYVIPPHIQHKLMENADPEIRKAALASLEIGMQIRGGRVAIAQHGLMEEGAPSPHKNRRVYNCHHGSFLMFANKVRAEAGRPSSDGDVNTAFDCAGDTWDFYQGVLQRNSIDDRGLSIDSYVHYRTGFDNAFWDGSRMVYGDGDGKIFVGFDRCIDVIGHELTHGVTQYTCNLMYQGEPGALNEHISDVFGITVKQWKLNQLPKDADWIIGEGVLAPGIKGLGLRSMKEPGTAYDDPQIGKDPQPSHMSGYVNTNLDNGGVHINSGIPNKAFYLTTIKIGQPAWESPIQIWYRALHFTQSNATFRSFAQSTVDAAKPYQVESAVAEAWKEVGVL